MTTPPNTPIEPISLPDPERALDLRALELRALDPDDLLRDDDPLPLPLFDSAISILLQACSATSGWAPHYFMPAAAAT